MSKSSIDWKNTFANAEMALEEAKRRGEAAGRQTSFIIKRCEELSPFYKYLPHPRRRFLFWGLVCPLCNSGLEYSKTIFDWHGYEYWHCPACQYECAKKQRLMIPD